MGKHNRPSGFTAHKNGEGLGKTAGTRPGLLGDHIIVCGQRGSGKSYAASKEMEMRVMAGTPILYCVKYNATISNPYIGCTRASGDCQHCQYCVTHPIMGGTPRGFLQGLHDNQIPRTVFQILQDEVKARQRFLSENPDCLEID